MNKKSLRGIGLYFVIFLIILATVFIYYDEPEEEIKEIPFSEQ